jgi:hypothetical protein
VKASIRRRPVPTYIPAAFAVAILLLNLWDAMLTLAVIESGRAVESNPLMRVPLEWGPAVFMACKLALVSCGVLLLWRLRETRVAVVALASVTAVYVGLCVYHFRSIQEILDYVA